MEKFKTISNLYDIGKRTKKWALDHKKTALAIPTITGGVWQFLELVSMGLPYGRRFSITQLLADGFVILFLIVIFIILAAFVFWIVDILLYCQDKYGLKKKTHIFQIFIYQLVTLFVFLIPITTFLLIYHPLQSIEVLIYVGSRLVIINIIWVTLVFYITKFKDWADAKIEEINKRKKLNESAPTPKKKPNLFVLLSPFLITVSGIILYFAHTTLLLPKNLSNLSKITCLMDRDFPDRKDGTQNIRYYNDKYIFVEFISKDGEELIQEYEYKVLFDHTICK